jgi:hypothetical protein
MDLFRKTNCRMVHHWPSFHGFHWRKCKIPFKKSKYKIFLKSMISGLRWINMWNISQVVPPSQKPGWAKPKPSGPCLLAMPKRTKVRGPWKFTKILLGQYTYHSLSRTRKFFIILKCRKWIRFSRRTRSSHLCKENWIWEWIRVQ